MSLVLNYLSSLSTGQVWLTIIFSTLAWYYLSTYRTRKLLAKLSGPQGWPLIGNLDLLWASKESVNVTAYRVLSELSKTFSAEGMFKLRLGPKNIVLLTAPDTIEMLLKCQVNIVKGPLFQLAECLFGQGLVMSSGNKWRTDRKLLTPAVHYEILDDLNAL